jgi:hypothetical protein
MCANVSRRLLAAREALASLQEEASGTREPDALRARGVAEGQEHHHHPHHHHHHHHHDI